MPKYRCTYDVEQAVGWHYTVEVDSPEEARSELEAGGGEFEEKDFEVKKGNFDGDSLEEIGSTDEEQE